MINHLLVSTCSRGVAEAAAAYARVGLRPVRLAPLHPESTPTAPRCSCSWRHRIHACEPNCPDHPGDLPGTVHSNVGEHPFQRGWQDQHLTESGARASFQRDDGVGLVMGRCQLGELLAIVLYGKIGHSTMRRLCEQHGRPPTTLTSTTRRKDEPWGENSISPLCLIYTVPPTYEGMLSSRSGNNRVARTNNGDSWYESYPGVSIFTGGIRGEHPTQVAVAPTLHWSGRRHRWTMPMLPTELPKTWCALLVEAIGSTPEVAENTDSQTSQTTTILSPASSLEKKPEYLIAGLREAPELREVTLRHQWHKNVCVLCGSFCRIDDDTRMRLYSVEGKAWQTNTTTCTGRRFFDP